jgi:hypothetical protein
VVVDLSSCLSDPTLESAQQIAANHMEMCRFSDPTKSDYRKVVAAVDRVLKSDEPRQQSEIVHGGASGSPSQTAQLDLTPQERQLYIDLLGFGIVDTSARIRKAHPGTCKWILETREYSEWQNDAGISDKQHLLWIKGKPGCGKSTMMKYLVVNAQESPRNRVVLGFFFDKKGQYLQRSTVGMYRSLLLQLFGQRPLLQRVLDLLGRPPPTGSERAAWSNARVWQVNVLQDLISEAFRRMRAGEILCFVDAIDECLEDGVRLIAHFKNVVALDLPGNISLCFSSGPYLNIGPLGSIILELDHNAGHLQDLDCYLESNVAFGDTVESQQLKQTLLGSAESEFVWLVLAVQMLKKALKREQIEQAQLSQKQVLAVLRQLGTEQRTESLRALLFKDLLLFDRFADDADTENKGEQDHDRDSVVSTSVGSFQSKSMRAATPEHLRRLFREDLRLRSFLTTAVNFSDLEQERLADLLHRYLRILSRDLVGELQATKGSLEREGCKVVFHQSRSLALELVQDAQREARSSGQQPETWESLHAQSQDIGQSEHTRRYLDEQFGSGQFEAAEIAETSGTFTLPPQEGDEDDAVSDSDSPLSEQLDPQSLVLDSCLNLFKESHSFFKFVDSLWRGAEPDLCDWWSINLRWQEELGEPAPIFLRRRFYDEIRRIDAEAAGLIDRAKCALEQFTGKPWDWWPFAPPKTPISAGKIRLKWNEVSFSSL